MGILTFTPIDPFLLVISIYCNENFEIIAFCNEYIIAISWYELFLNLLQWQNINIP